MRLNELARTRGFLRRPLLAKDAVNPDSLYAGAQLGAVAPEGSHQGGGAATGTYPKHFFSTGPGDGEGAIATADSRAGIMPALPQGLPSYTPPSGG